MIDTVLKRFKMSRTLISVFLFSALFAVAFGDFRLIRGPANFNNQSSCIAQNGNKYYFGWFKNSENEERESSLFSLNLTSGKTERVFPEWGDRTRKLMSQERENLKGWTTEYAGSPTLICAGNKLFLEISLQKEPAAGFTREHRTHIILDLDLEIIPAPAPAPAQYKTKKSLRGQ